jgi:L-threonylcarbamoyladenylate synthase
MLSMNIQTANDGNIKKAAAILRDGGLVAFATETVYGLGADATNDLAVATIFSTKGRPQFNPLIIHVANVESAKQYVAWNEMAEKLSKKFWPGPLTLILKRLPDCKISLLASAGGNTIAIRIPANKTALALLQEVKLPVAAPSANRSGRISPTTAEAVYAELGEDIPFILDGGPCDVGIESTVLDISDDKISVLRPGSVTREHLQAFLGMEILLPGETAGDLKSPGMLASHYAPTLPVRLNATDAKAGEVLLGFGNAPGATLNLSPSGNLKEAAANLFSFMRQLDKPETYSGIAIISIPEEGIGIAINDRLKRAAKR